MEPKSIAELRGDFNLPNVHGVKKGPDSVEFGERWLDDLDFICIDPKRTPNIAREFESIDYQTDRAFLAPGAESDLRPKLEGEVIDGLPPVYLGITHETVEHVFLASQQAA